MDIEQFCKHYPQLFHMAHVDSWESIKKHGLLSTTALLDLFEISGEPRLAIESQCRPECVSISNHKYGTAVIRDNKPLPESKLSQCLTDMSTKEWYELLNQKVFFWPTKERVLGLLHARAYRKHSHIVITLDARSLISEQIQNICLSRINSGAAPYSPTPRGSGTFVRLPNWPTDEGPRSGKLKSAVAEVAVDYSVPNITKVATCVEEMRDGEEPKLIWAS